MSYLQIQERQGSLRAMHITIEEDEIAYLVGLSGTLAIAKTNGNFFYLETESEEVVLFTDPEDLMVASSQDIGEKVRRGLCCTIYQLRELGAPLIVLPKGHPASPRLKTVVSIGSSTRLSCKILPGTHPEQDVLCGSEEFHDAQVLAKPGGAEILGMANKECEIIVQKL
ncbi:MAG: hypothetical protein QG575_31 [Euryarchaeota archaeon]|nr:hypothetical protein [Euryarchaeota archaeon]